MQDGARGLRDLENGPPADAVKDPTSGLGTPTAPVAKSPPPASPAPRCLAPDVEVSQSSDDDDDDDDDGLAGDNSIYGGEDDARSFIQPVISPVATRLSSPRTPAAEKAMAMDQMIDGAGGSGGPGFFDAFVPPDTLQEHRAPTAPIMQTQNAVPRPSAMAAAVQSGTRHSRSSSVGSDALRRLSKALPSISFPSASSFLPSLSTPSFFSSSNVTTTSPTTSPTTATAAAPSPMVRRSATTASTSRPPLYPSPSIAPRRPYVLPRSTSDDSLLYATLSRTSSHDDPVQFEHIREQVNSRVKAIMDSFDRPTFKMPQLPSFFNDDKVGATSAPREPLLPLDAALETLTGDVVVLGGYRGSILRSAEPPHRQLWVPVKVGLNIRKVNLEVGLDPEDEETMPQRIFPSGMLKHIGPVDISRRLFKKLRECENARNGTLRVHDYGYDWRLSPHRLSKQFISFLETLPCNTPGASGNQGRGAVVIAHSLGGLITRHAVNLRPELFAGVIYAGTPQRCVNILGPIRNGDAVLLNEKVLTAQVNFSLRTTFALLPDDGFCFINSKDPTEEYRVDFFDIQDWLRYRWSPCVGTPALPSIQPPGGGGSGFFGGDGSVTFNPKRSSSTLFSRNLIDDLSSSLPSRPLRSRHNSTIPHPSFSIGPDSPVVAQAKDRLVSPQINKDGGSGANTGDSDAQVGDADAPGDGAFALALDDPQVARSIAYLTRTLADIKQFRTELAHQPELTAANAYPPLAVIYGKGVPTVYAARVASREAIACVDAYDDLVFRTGDGVVLAREATLPEGYHYVRGGYISTGRGHVGMLGDLSAVGDALAAIMRGRQKGIGLGPLAAKSGRPVPGPRSAADAETRRAALSTPMTAATAGSQSVVQLAL